MADYVELFAGAGGWSLAAQRLGLSGIGIELDPTVCATRRNADFQTLRCDAAALDPLGDMPRTPGLIASPPCQSFSAAGNGSGRGDMARLVHAVATFTCDGVFADPRTTLILEPLRWIMLRALAGHRFDWIAMEQVPTCLPLWAAYAAQLERMGYFTAVGFMHAERHGVAQTRKRAVLIAHWHKPVWLPAQTHSRYYSREPRRLDHGFPKWISMAEALGWDPDFEMVSNYSVGGDITTRGLRLGSEPAFTVTSKINRNRVRFLRSNYSAGSSHTGTAAERGRAFRAISEPAFTIGGRGGDMWSEAANDDGPRDRLTPGEAGVLQSFPADFPWQGTSTEQYQQVGNCVPVLLAQAILREVTGSKHGA